MRFLQFIIGIGCLVFLFGCQHTRQQHQAVRLHWEDTSAHPARRTQTAELPRSELVYLVDSEPVLWEGDFLNAELVQVDLGLCVLLQCTPRGTRELYRQTASRRGDRLILMVDHQPIGVRYVEAPVEDGNFFVFVELPDDELPGFVIHLKNMLQKQA